MKSEQPMVIRKAWEDQVKLYEKSGRGSESSLAF
jgi:hypothetical protein